MKHHVVAIFGLVLGVLSSSSEAAPLARRDFRARMAFQAADGEVTQLLGIRLRVTYSSSLLGNCQVEVGRADAGGLWMETESYDCKVVGDSAMVSNEVIGAIALRSARFPLVSRTLREQIERLVESGEVSRIDGDAGSDLVGGIGIQSLSMDEVTRLVLSGSRNQPQISFSITPKVN